MFGKKTESVPTLVYQYEVRSAMSPRLTPEDYVIDQLRLANIYRNKLVNANIKGSEAYRAKRREVGGGYAQLEDEIFAIQQGLEGLNTQIKRVKSNAKLNKIKCVIPPELTQAKMNLLAIKKSWIQELNKIKEDLKASGISADIANASNEVAQPLIKAAKAWANEVGLYECTARKTKEALEQRYKSKTCKSDPTYRRFDGGGRLSVQLQQSARYSDEDYDDDGYLKDGAIPIGTKKPLATWGNIIAGVWDTLLRVRIESRARPDRNGIMRGNGRNKLPWTIVSVRLGSDAKGKPIWVDCPIVMHRPFPADAVIKWVELIRRREGREFKYYICFQLAKKSGWVKPDQATEGTVSVHMGFGRVCADGVRVAVWQGSDKESGELIIPFGRIEYAKKQVDLQAIRDLKFDAMKARLQAYIETNDKPQWMLKPNWLDPNADKWLMIPDRLFSGNPKYQIKSKDRIIEWLKNWQRHEGDDEIYNYLFVGRDAWVNKEIHLERWETNQRRNFEDWRKDIYRKFWAMLRRKYAKVILPNINWAELRRNPPPEIKDDASLTYYANISAPGNLCEGAFAKPIKVDALDLTSVCHACGRKCEYNHKDLVHTCDHCHTTWDQDHNACRNQFARAEVMEQNPAAARNADDEVA